MTKMSYSAFLVPLEDNLGYTNAQQHHRVDGEQEEGFHFARAVKNVPRCGHGRKRNPNEAPVCCGAIKPASSTGVVMVARNPTLMGPVDCGWSLRHAMGSRLVRESEIEREI